MAKKAIAIDKKPGLKKLTTRNAVPFRGGSYTDQEPALLEPGRYSMVQNMRPTHPGFVQRKGATRAHTTADETNKVLNLYQFSKGKITERHFFAQMADGDVLEATGAPPAVTADVFGAEVYSGTAGSDAASFSHLQDIMLYSNNIDQHQLYAGDGNYVSKFVKFDGAAAPPNIPVEGFDYTKQVTDGDATTVATLNSLNTIAAFECVFICTPVPANKLTFTVLAANTTASIATLNYRKDDNTWATTSMTDTTIEPAGDTLGKTGSMTWTQKTDEIPMYMYGLTGYWYQLVVSVQLDSTVTISSCTYASAFSSLTNVWNGLSDYVIEAIFEDDTATLKYTYSGDSVTVSAMTTSDALYVSSYDRLQGLYIDVGETPNTVTTTTFASGDIEYWDGDSWVTVGALTDNTSGLGNTGWITWGRVGTDLEQRLNFNSSGYYAYWYRIQISTATTGADMNLAIEGMPYFDITDFGKGGVSSVWKDRAIYSFDKYPEYMYVSAKNRPNVLNGSDHAILEAGDGRSNAITCIKKFHNEIMIWQEEKGKEGGCLTLYEGYSPATFGKLVLSTKVGTFNNKSAVVVDGVLTSTKTDEKLKTIAYFISHYGICASDGLTVTVISDDIQNYFDPSDTTNCIRRGYEKEMWVEHDTAYNVLRFGLVTGTTATVCNTFPVFDLTDKAWSFDVHGQALSCMTEVEAATGNIPILQYGGGTDDGGIYRLNTGTNDVDIANTTVPIDAYIRVEIGLQGLILALRNLVLRMKTQTAGDCTVTPYRNNTAGSDTLALSMIAETIGDAVRRHRVGVNIQGQQMSLKIQNSVASQELHLLDLGFELWEKVDH